jgi:hypothetical protein
MVTPSHLGFLIMLDFPCWGFSSQLLNGVPRPVVYDVFGVPPDSLFSSQLHFPQSGAMNDRHYLPDGRL